MKADCITLDTLQNALQNAFPDAKVYSDYGYIFLTDEFGTIRISIDRRNP